MESIQLKTIRGAAEMGEAEKELVVKMTAAFVEAAKEVVEIVRAAEVAEMELMSCEEQREMIEKIVSEILAAAHHSTIRSIRVHTCGPGTRTVTLVYERVN